MKNNLTNDEIITRIAMYRIKRNMSARELSLRMGHTESYFYKIENGTIALNIPKLLEALEILEVSTAEFFYPDMEDYEKDMNVVDTFNKLSKENKDKIVAFMKNRDLSFIDSFNQLSQSNQARIIDLMKHMN